MFNIERKILETREYRQRERKNCFNAKHNAKTIGSSNPAGIWGSNFRNETGVYSILRDTGYHKNVYPLQQRITPLLQLYVSITTSAERNRSDTSDMTSE